jgi:hypothetical protein
MIPRHLQVALILLLVAALGLGYYALHLKRNAEQTQQSDTRPITPPVKGPSESTTLFVAHDDDGVLRKQEINMALPAEPGERAQHVLRALLAIYLQKPSPHPLGDGADVKNVYVMDDNTAVIDTNLAFADAHHSGVLEEELTIVSMVQTLSAALPKITRVKFLVNGHERDTLAGHSDLRTFYDVATVNQIAREMQ